MPPADIVEADREQGAQKHEAGGERQDEIEQPGEPQAKAQAVTGQREHSADAEAHARRPGEILPARRDPLPGPAEIDFRISGTTTSKDVTTSAIVQLPQVAKQRPCGGPPLSAIAAGALISVNPNRTTSADALILRRRFDLDQGRCIGLACQWQPSGANANRGGASSLPRGDPTREDPWFIGRAACRAGPVGAGGVRRGRVRLFVIAALAWGWWVHDGRPDRFSARLPGPQSRHRVDDVRAPAAGPHLGRGLRVRRQRPDRYLPIRRAADLPHDLVRWAAPALFLFWGYQLFIVLAASGYVLGVTQGREYAEPEWYVDLWLTVLWVLYLTISSAPFSSAKSRTSTSRTGTIWPSSSQLRYCISAIIWRCR